jgi:hypothetical protein
MTLAEFLAYAASDCVNANHAAAEAPAEDRATFAAFCQAGHRIIPSTDEHSTWVEILPGVYMPVSGPCDELEAAADQPKLNREGPWTTSR